MQIGDVLADICQYLKDVSLKTTRSLPSWRLFHLMSFTSNVFRLVFQATHKRTSPADPTKASSGTWEYASGKHIAGFWALEKMVPRQNDQLRLDSREEHGDGPTTLEEELDGHTTALVIILPYFAPRQPLTPAARSSTVRRRVALTPSPTSGSGKCCACASVESSRSKDRTKT